MFNLFREFASETLAALCYRCRSFGWMLAVIFVMAGQLASNGQITISGVTDKTTYNNSVTLTVGTQPGYNYSATLNWKPIATGTPAIVNKPDFYELRVDATNQTTSAVASQYLRFIVNSSERADTEWGLPPHVPFPVIQSCSNEFVGAHLRVLVPSAWPGGLPLPVVTWVMDEQEHAVRANGIVQGTGGYYGGLPAPSFQIKRGVGSALIPTTTNADALTLQFSLSGLKTNPPVTKESNVVWTTVSGVLAGNTTWPPNARMQVTGGLTVPNGATLTIGEGAIVRLNSGVDITNNGTVTINGTTQKPVAFLPSNTGQFWGGFIMRTANQGVVNATATIFTGSGANQSWFGSAGNPSSHRNEQALFFCQAGQQLNLTDSAAIYLAGQLGHSVGQTTMFNANRFLMQRTTTGGEWTGARFTVNDSAFIECPDDSVNFVDGDNDGIYIVDGTHFFTNSLFGWTKDDGIDSGGSGYGPLTYQSCWFEATFHEGNSLSGYKNTFSRDTVYFDCGQGIEDGYNGPTGRVDHCLFSMCEAGIRHGDNYPTIGNYDGRFTGTNCISIYNHRDLFGFNWHNPGGWTNSYDRFWVSNNFVSALDTNYPNNALWNPATDGWRLGTLGGVGRVGLGFGVRGNSLAQLPDGVPVGLSRFCTNQVSVNYKIETEQGTATNGTVIFPPGLTHNTIPLGNLSNAVVHVALSNPTNADITSASSLYLQTQGGGSGPNLTLVANGSVWKYLDTGVDQGTAWRAANFNDATWKSGPAELGFGDGDEATVISNVLQITTYFRRTFTVADPSTLGQLTLTLKRDDAGVVFINGTEVFRSPNLPAGAISYGTLATVTGENSIDTANFSPAVLQAGTNIIAVEMHQQATSSSDVTFDLSLTAAPTPRLSYTRFGTDFVNYWQAAGFALEEADVVTGPWRTVATNSPAAAPISGNRFFRLKK